MAQQESGQGGVSPARMAGYLAAAIAFAVFGLVLAQLERVSGSAILFDLDWAPSLGIGFSFLLDPLALVFAALISGIGGLIFIYATGYMGGHPQFGRFVLFLFLFMLSMLGLVLARDLITLFVFWELTSLTSYLLIGFAHDDPRARRNALQAMLVTASGGLALLAGFILIGTAAGSYDLAVILQGGGLQQSPLYGAILVLVLLGAFTKSAQIPFHFWLPNAMAAPTPVSAYLHSATMVKAGVYLLARLHPLLSGTDGWEVSLTLAGGVTALFASVIALRQRDLKQMLAWTTLMALGVLVLMLAQDTAAALTAAIAFLIIHALYKAALFMVVGAVDHATGTRDVRALRGLRRGMPLTAVLALLAAGSMAGLPPFSGWIGKELLYTGAIPLLVPLLLVSNALIFAVAGGVALRPFFGPPPGDLPSGALPSGALPHEPGWQLLLGPLLLGGAGLLFGLMPGLLQPLLDAVLRGFGLDHAAGLHLWAGGSLPLVLSLATFALGSLLFLAAPRLRAQGEGPRLADRLWDRLLEVFAAIAAWQTRVIQSGRLSRYLVISFTTLALVLGVTLAARRPALAIQPDAPLSLWLIAAFTIGGAGLALTPHSRIANIAGIGTVGIGVALIFLIFGAPDVAMTQLMVESLAAVLFGIALLRLPGLSERRSPGRRALHWLISGAAGLAVTLLLLAITAHPPDRQLATWFEENAFTRAHGLNIVNVILVDFRAFDTFGELTVVLLAAIGASALLKRRIGGARR
ncbi:hydrogen gas-evolving membrane-bound hydrogenase subunit E [Pseudogemmobacter bohemicus]|uniref:hydrogen gas-evolving membrane-bound hydrogenase subunit E n=1 Tax=Pseudogemmobacter bohemicus TaxID=2250708 RepID=UPI001E63B1C5|nr:hydrogen gas-evolving membrane-bound hydrogenase subunit E [Pseudogemmobacter bohemicus]